jgi:large subunit ribosomal protein L4
VSLRNLPQVHLLEASQLNTYDVLVADEVVFTETALAEYVDGRSTGAGVEKPDLRTPDIPGAIPSVKPDHGTTDLDVADSAVAAEAPAKKAAKKVAAKKAPAEKAAAADDAPAEKAAAKKAPAKKAATEVAAADETIEETA